jgi:ABC-type glycerol-3-phosphate transport system substrate-binding protein
MDARQIRLKLGEPKGASRRRWLGGTLLSALGATALVAACGGARTQSSGDVERVPAGTTLTYVASHSQSDVNLLQPQFKAFEDKHPSAKVDFANTSTSIGDKVIALLASATPFDMFYTGQTNWPQLANKGAMLDLNSRVKRDRYDLADFVDAAVSQYVWKDKRIGFGANVGFTVLYYNADAFQEKGVPVPSDDWAKPWTWAQSVDTLRRVAIPGAAGGEPERYGLTGLDGNAVYRLQATNGVLATNPEATRTLLDTPEAIETLDWLYDLVHTYGVAQNPLNVKQLSPQQAFLTGKAIMWLQSTPVGVTTLLPQKNLFTWDLATTPRGPSLKTEKWCWGGGNGWYLGVPSQTPDAAWELLKFMLQPDTGRALAAGGWPPNRTSVINSPEWLRPGQPPAHKRPAIDGAKLLVPSIKLVNWGDFDAAVQDELSYLWRGERRGKEVGQRLRQRTDPILAEHQRLFKEGK